MWERSTSFEDNDRFDPGLLEVWCGSYSYVWEVRDKIGWWGCRCEIGCGDVKWVFVFAVGLGGKRAQSSTGWFIISPSQCQMRGITFLSIKKKNKLKIKKKKHLCSFRDKHRCEQISLAQVNNGCFIKCAGKEKDLSPSQITANLCKYLVICFLLPHLRKHDLRLCWTHEYKGKQTLQL